MPSLLIESLPEGNACNQLWHHSWCQMMVICEGLIAPSHPRTAEEAAYTILSWTRSNNRLIRNCMTIDIPCKMVTNQKAASLLLRVRITAVPFINNFFPSLQLLAWFLSVDIYMCCALQTWQPNSPSNLLKFNFLLRDQHAVTHMTIALHVISFSSDLSLCLHLLLRNSGLSLCLDLL